MLAEGDKPGLNANGFDATYTWSVMNIAYGIYSGKTNIKQLDSVINYNNRIFPESSMRMYFTTNHDENSWNGTEFERFGDAYKTFAIWSFTMDKTIPLIYGGQEEPNKKRLKFFTKDPIHWATYSLAGFYTSLIHFRHEIPALSSDASFRRIKTNHDQEVFGYVLQKGKSKVLVLFNFSNKNFQVKIDD
jgi:glycosidase